MTVARTFIFIASSLPAADVVAHHSPAAFDMDAVVAIEGTVTRFDWRNPHVYIDVEAVDADGRRMGWTIETDWTSDLLRIGWDRRSLSPGERVSARVHPARNRARRYGNLIALSKQDGTVLTSWDLGGFESPDTAGGARSLAGRWLPDQGFPQFFNAATAAANAAGLRAQADFREAQNPGIDCVPHPLPTRLGMRHVNDIEIFADRVVVHSESDAVPRVIYTDGRALDPAAAPRNQGHSVGRWDGDTLVVETTGFAPHRRGNGFGIPSSPAKRLVERYALLAGGTALTVDYRLEDPAYLADAVTGRIVWRHGPGLGLVPYSCDPEVARRHLGLD
jgi:hypothetical protein